MSNAAQTSLILSQGIKTMSSLEIAGLVESRHDSVKRTIERCVEGGVIVQPPMVDEQSADSMGRLRSTQVYHLDKRSSLIVVAQLSPEFTARIVDRWQELEAQTKPAALPPTAQARQIIEDDLAVAMLFGVPLHLAQSESVKHARMLTGVDYSHLLAYSPAQNDIQYEQMMLEPTELGKRYGLSAMKMNQALANAGLQVKGDDGWVATEAARGAWSRHQWVSGSKSGYNLKWNVRFVERALPEMKKAA